MDCTKTQAAIKTTNQRHKKIQVKSAQNVAIQKGEPTAELPMRLTQSQHIAKIKEKIAKNEFEILSHDKKCRESAAMRTAKQFLIFESQLLILDCGS